MVPAKRVLEFKANEKTVVCDKPVFTAFQATPLLVDKKTPSNVPAKILLPHTAIAGTIASIKVVASQLLPLFDELYTPKPSVPAKILVPLTARDLIILEVNPVFAEFQLVPLLEERYIPVLLPAKIFDPFKAKTIGRHRV